MQIIKGENVNIYSWASFLESEAIDQARQVARMPEVFHHVSLMPDAHAGKGIPVGGVVALKGAISPQFVGSDVGCGMLYIQTQLRAAEFPKGQRIKVYREVRQVVPLGMNWHERPQAMLKGFGPDDGGPIVKEQYERAKHQMATLGGGNHFIEFQEDENGLVGLMIHTGSRNLGYQIGEHYHKLAVKGDGKGDKVLGTLGVDTDLGKIYIAEMTYATAFALENRSKIAERVLDIFIRITGHKTFSDAVNIHHNYASLEEHFGEKVWVHRKGATFAGVGNVGIIPGSQGSRSYLVEGLGNPESYLSSSHGAGRTMSRAKAKKALNLEDSIRKMDEQGIIHGLAKVSDLDEAMEAYKDIDIVMNDQQDLVKVIKTLRPIIAIKDDTGYQED